MERIIDKNNMDDWHNLLIADTKNITGTDLVYEMINIDEWFYVAIKHKNDSYKRNTYYELSSGDLALNDHDFEQMLVSKYLEN